MTAIITADNGELSHYLALQPMPDRQVLASIQSYLDELAPSGRRAIEASIKRMAKVVGIEAYRLPWQAITAGHIEALKQALQRNNMAPATINHTVSTIRGVMQRLWRDGHIDDYTHNRIKAVRGVKGSRLVAGRDIQASEMAQLMATCELSTPAGIRDSAIIAVLYASGLRIHELAKLDMATYDATAGRFVVIGKGNKQRAVYIGQARHAVNQWIATRGATPGALFVPINKGNRIYVNRTISISAIYNMLIKRGSIAGIASFSPHDFRRTCIGNLLTAGKDIATIARQVGHASITTTARYDRRPEAQQRHAIDSIAVPGLHLT